MKKTDLDKIAYDFLANQKDVESVIVSSDGLVFINKNAADLHKNTNKAKEKLKLSEYTRNAKASDDTTEDAMQFPLTEKDVKAIKLPELQKIAEDLKIDISDLDTKAKIADAINTLKAKA